MRIQVTERIEPGEYELSPLAAPVPEPEPEDPPPDPPPEPEPEPPPVVVEEEVDSVLVDGIEFEFAGPTRVAQYLNGDFWVPPGTVVVGTSPGWDGSRGGAMVNPCYINDSNGQKQGYDSQLASFSAAKRTTFPYTMRDGDSLVATWSWREGEPGCPSSDNTRHTPRPLVRRAAVLTCTVAPPLPGQFRPAYAGGLKLAVTSGRLINLDTLPKLNLPANAPSIVDVLNDFDALWLDHRGQWHCQYYAPSESMPDYDRNQAALVGNLMLLLLGNIPLADKRKVAEALCQIGLDQYGVHTSVPMADWGNGGGGHGSGRRAPVIVTGFLLGLPEMLDFFVGKSVKLSLETAQVGRDSEGVYWRERTTNDRASPGKTNYRKCCTANAWIAPVIAMRALGLQPSWDFPDSFEYQDAYMFEGVGFDNQRNRAWEEWHGTFWDATNGGRHAP